MKNDLSFQKITNCLQLSFYFIFTRIRVTILHCFGGAETWWAISHGARDHESEPERMYSRGPQGGWTGDDIIIAGPVRCAKWLGGAVEMLSSALPETYSVPLAQPLNPARITIDRTC